MLLALAFLSVMRESAAVVDCRLACRRCREKTDLLEMVEVYCAMCTECKERRIERMQTTTDCYSVQEIVDCPEPSCEDLDHTEKVPLKKTTTSSTTPTPTPTTTTTTRRPCHTAPCKPPPCYCMPFMPMTVCPCPSQSVATTGTIKEKLVLPKRRNDYSYVYVGVPKDLLIDRHHV